MLFALFLLGELIHFLLRMEAKSFVSRGRSRLNNDRLVDNIVQQILISIQVVIVGIGELVGLRRTDHLVEVDSIVFLHNASVSLYHV